MINQDYDEKGFDHVHNATVKGFVKSIEKFILTDANELEKVTRDGLQSTPLLLAAQYDHLDVFKLLVTLGANLNHVNTKSCGIIDICVEHESFNVIFYMINVWKAQNDNLNESVEKSKSTEKYQNIFQKLINTLESSIQHQSKIVASSSKIILEILNRPTNEACYDEMMSLNLLETLIQVLNSAEKCMIENIKINNEEVLSMYPLINILLKLCYTLITYANNIQRKCYKQEKSNLPEIKKLQKLKNVITNKVTTQISQNKPILLKNEIIGVNIDIMIRLYKSESFQVFVNFLNVTKQMVATSRLYDENALLLMSILNIVTERSKKDIDHVEHLNIAKYVNRKQRHVYKTTRRIIKDIKLYIYYIILLLIVISFFIWNEYFFRETSLELEALHYQNIGWMTLSKINCMATLSEILQIYIGFFEQVRCIQKKENLKNTSSDVRQFKDTLEKEMKKIHTIGNNLPDEISDGDSHSTNSHYENENEITNDEPLIYSINKIIRYNLKLILNLVTCNWEYQTSACADGKIIQMLKILLSAKMLTERNVNKSLIESICECIRQLTWKNKINQNKFFDTFNVFKPILRIIKQHRNNLKMQIMAVNVIEALIVDNEKNQEIGRDLGLIYILLQLMSIKSFVSNNSPTKKGQYAKKLSFSYKTSKREISSDSVEQELKKKNLYERSTITLWELGGTNIETQYLMASLIGVSRLINLLSLQSAQLQYIGSKGLGVLSTLSCDCSLSSQPIIESNGVFSLIKLMKSNNHSIVLQSVKTLGCLCIDIGYIPNERIQNSLSLYRGIENLLALQMFCDDISIRIESGLTLSCLCLKNQLLLEKCYNNKDFDLLTYLKFFRSHVDLYESSLHRISSVSNEKTTDIKDCVDSLGTGSISESTNHQDNTIEDVLTRCISASMTIATFCYNNVTNQIKFAQYGGIHCSFFVNILNNPIIEPKFKIIVAFQSIILSRIMTGIKKVNICCIAISLLTKYLDSSEKTIILSPVADCIARLSHTRCGIKNSFVAIGIIPILCRHLTNHSEWLRRSASIALMYFSYNKSAARQMLGIFHRRESLFQVMQHYTKEKVFGKYFTEMWFQKNLRHFSFKQDKKWLKNLLTSEMNVNTSAKILSIKVVNTDTENSEKSD
ncbi:hypothetical protein A3Q56_00331 [Intoshia linei]|uniref:Uncharacterized protein n=1 Tax=Intoshia linei TaxID=1819745 RepID=A0A177BDW0_9BILA|nr:hypothetical protein A3Q56_00331 [Intoshia linei]